MKTILELGIGDSFWVVNKFGFPEKHIVEKLKSRGPVHTHNWYVVLNDDYEFAPVLPAWSGEVDRISKSSTTSQISEGRFAFLNKEQAIIYAKDCTEGVNKAIDRL